MCVCGLDVIVDPRKQAARLSGSAVAGIVTAVLTTVLIVVVIAVLLMRRRRLNAAKRSRYSK